MWRLPLGLTLRKPDALVAVFGSIRRPMGGIGCTRTAGAIVLDMRRVMSKSTATSETAGPCQELQHVAGLSAVRIGPGSPGNGIYQEDGQALGAVSSARRRAGPARRHHQ